MLQVELLNSKTDEKKTKFVIRADTIKNENFFKLNKIDL